MKLDTRPARCDLTSRECCKLLCGVLAGATPLFAQPDTVRRFFRVLYVTASGDQDGCRKAVEALSGLELNVHDSVALECVSRLFGAVLGAITEQAAPGAMDDAIKWIAERDDSFWADLSAAVTNEN